MDAKYVWMTSSQGVCAAGVGDKGSCNRLAEWVTDGYLKTWMLGRSRGEPPRGLSEGLSGDAVLGTPWGKVSSVSITGPLEYG